MHDVPSLGTTQSRPGGTLRSSQLISRFSSFFSQYCKYSTSIVIEHSKDIPSYNQLKWGIGTSLVLT